MRAIGIASVLAVFSLFASAATRPHVYRTGQVVKVEFQERQDSPRVELTDKVAPPALMGFVHLTIRSEKSSYTATTYAYRPDDYPLVLRPGQRVRFRISNERYIECDVHAVMTMRWVTQLTLRSPKGHLWPLEIAPIAVPALDAKGPHGLPLVPDKK